MSPPPTLRLPPHRPRWSTQPSLPYSRTTHLRADIPRYEIDNQARPRLVHTCCELENPSAKVLLDEKGTVAQHFYALERRGTPRSPNASDKGVKVPPTLRRLLVAFQHLRPGREAARFAALNRRFPNRGVPLYERTVREQTISKVEKEEDVMGDGESRKRSMLVSLPSKNLETVVRAYCLDNAFMRA